MEKATGEICNSLYAESIEETAKIWKKHLEWADETKPILRYFIAAPNECYQKILGYICSQMNIDVEKILNLKIEGIECDLTAKLENIARIIEKREENLIVVVVSGFEGRIKRLANDLRDKFAYEMTLTRFGHDYDQNIAENKKLKGIYSKMNKKIVLITMIGKKDGEEFFKDAVRTAVGSHFRDGMIIVE